MTSKKLQIPNCVLEAGDAAVEIYRQSIAAGSDPRFAEMCALRQPPGSRYTDRAADEGIHNQMSKHCGLNQKLMHDIAKRAGINTSGKVHKASLGKVTDPLAWVSCADDIRRAAKAKKLAVEGVVRCDFSEKTERPVKRTRMARDVVDHFERKYRAADPGLNARCRSSAAARKELRAMIRENHGRPKKKGKKVSHA